MKSKIGVAAVTGFLATVLFATLASAQCNPAPNYPGVMIKFDNDAWAHETAYTPATLISAPGSQLAVVGRVSVFCSPFGDLDPLDPNTDYTFIWDGLTSQGTTSKLIGSTMQYTTKYAGGGFRIYAGSPRNAPTAPPPALPAPGVVPDAFVDGTMILGGVMDTLVVIVNQLQSGSYSSSFRTNYSCTGGTRYNQVGDAVNLLAGSWCPVPPAPPAAPIGTCTLPAGWSAHPTGRWDSPSTVPALPATWGKIKMLYR